MIAVLRAATGSLPSEAVKNLVIERRGQVLTPAQTRQIASRVAHILKYLRQRGVVHDVTPAGRRYHRLWVLAERADELAPLAPTPVLQMTEETELALEILEGLTEAPTTKELARRVLHAKG